MANLTYPAPILDAWRDAGKRGAKTFAEWNKKYHAGDTAQRSEFERLMRRELPDGWMETLQAHKKKLAETLPNEATRKSSENALEVLTAAIPELIGGSADLTGSNNTKTKRHAARALTRRYMRAAISITACASMPWAR